MHVLWLIEFKESGIGKHKARSQYLELSSIDSGAGQCMANFLTSLIFFLLDLA